MQPQSFFQHGYNRVLATIILVLVAIALGAYAHLTIEEARYINTGPTTISVTGTGEVLSVPDIGQFSFSVMAEGDDANAAQEKSAQSINAIVDYLKGEGVADKDIKTTNYNLYPKYRYEERTCISNSYCPPGERIMDGFSVTQTILVKVRETDKAGDLISGVGEKGATDISGLTFTIDDEDSLLAEAREKAIADAKDKAKTLANDLGVRIVRISGYWENQGGYPQPYGYGGADMAMSESSVKNIAPQVPTGENKLSVSVNISYEVK